jgi:hypothetical protein
MKGELKMSKDQNNFSDKWEVVSNVDPMRRKPLEWARIYLMELITSPPEVLMNEYEWAYSLMSGLFKYNLLPDKNGDFDKSGLMELRAMELKRDLFMGADMGERYVLQKQYIETEWLRRKMTFM